MVANKPNRSRQRHSSVSSENSEEDEFHSCLSSPSVSRDNSPVRDCDESVRVKDKIGSGGGFSHVLSERGFVKRDIYLFPTKVISASEREENAR